MSKYNNITGDRLSNTLKSNQEAFAKGWDIVFGKEDLDVKATVDWGIDSDPVDVDVEAGEQVTRIVNEYLNDQT